MEHTAPLPGLADRFAMILGDLAATWAARMARNFAATHLVVLLWGRLQRAIKRFARLVAQFEAGTLPKPRPSRPPDDRARPARPYDLPKGFGWVVQVMQEAMGYGLQLQHLMAQPEMAGLLQTPQAGRILRPLYNMLAIPLPAVLRPARRPARPPAMPLSGPDVETDAKRSTRRQPGVVAGTPAPPDESIELTVRVTSHPQPASSGS